MRLNGKTFFFFIFALLFASSSFSADKKNAKMKKSSKPSKVKVVAVVSDEGSFQAKAVENRVGNVKLVLRGSLGSFQIYAVDSDETEIPVLSTLDDFVSSYFSVLVGKKEYRMYENSGVIAGTRKTDLGTQVVYVVPDEVRLLVKFEAMKSGFSDNEDMIKITAVVKNTGKKAADFALKNVLDTTLGEQRGPHFSTAEDSAINSEMQIRKFDKVRWMSSGNQKVSMQVFFSGGDISVPEVVSLANKDFISLPSWIPNAIRSRSFDSVLSYNNSAICINWEKVRLLPDGEASFIYYIALTTDGKKINGEDFIASIEKILKENGDIQKYSVKEFEDAYQKALTYAEQGDYENAMTIVLWLWEKPEHRNGRLESLKNYIAKMLDASRSEDFEKKLAELNANMPYTEGGKSSNEKIDYGYVYELIQKIYALESGSDVDRAEIMRLNSELDAAMDDLRD